MTLSVARKLAILHEIAPFLASWSDYQARYRGATGVQLAVAYRGELVLEHAWGLANAETEEPLTPRHLFRIASHSKTMTAVIVLRLAERGVLRLDDAAGRHVAEIAGTEAGAVTVRELLGHQAGIIRDSSDGDFWQRGRDFPDAEELVGILRREGRVFASNERFKYSNIGYALLGLVAERATGRSYADLAEELVVRPLGLGETGPEYDPSRADAYAAGHTGRIGHADARRVIPHVDTRALAAATGWYSTASDLTRYAAAHVHGDESMLSDASKRLMQRPESRIAMRGLPESVYGLGLDVQKIAGIDLVGHSGGYPGHITRTWLDPRDGLTVTVLANDVDGPAGPLSAGIVHLVSLAWSAAEEEPEGVPDALAFSGRFANLWGVVDVVDLGGILHVVASRAPEPAAGATRLVVEDGRLVREPVAGYHETGEPVSVVRDDDGRIARIRLGSMTYWPFEVFDEAMSQTRPQERLGRLSL
ncbi:serine hydrolase [Microbacterium betulae]|uniref:Serine hydrolase n=1 Tax=Microbacterium betulae TaxID=2981139 RepID=A0AA97FI63_9MICO|nr:serine hydrolase domain-containing protein [Microbacterium sp. AB]WOF21982.1 serine hydrolase [Microbacterium sp. AB]